MDVQELTRRIVCRRTRSERCTIRNAWRKPWELLTRQSRQRKVHESVSASTGHFAQRSIVHILCCSLVLNLVDIRVFS